MILAGLVDQATGESLMRWTVRAAVVCYLVRVTMLLRRPPDQRMIPSTAECLVWSLGCGAYLVHVACAFHFVHEWSHEAAYQHTAAETEKFLGMRRGEGIWVNYLFTAIWVADVIRVAAARIRGQATSRWVDRSVQAFFAFIVFNATIVFGPTGYRLLAIPAALAMGWLWRRGRWRTPTRQNE